MPSYNGVCVEDVHVCVKYVSVCPVYCPVDIIVYIGYYHNTVNIMFVQMCLIYDKLILSISVTVCYIAITVEYQNNIMDTLRSATCHL